MSQAFEPSYTWQEEQAFRRLTWSWARCFDIKLHYAEFLEGLIDEVKTREQWARDCSAQNFFGDTRLQTQHLLGEAVFEKVNAINAAGHWQASAVHRRRLSDGRLVEWAIASYLDQYYELVDGEWKLVGLKPHTVVTQNGQMSEIFGDFE